MDLFSDAIGYLLGGTFLNLEEILNIIRLMVCGEACLAILPTNYYAFSLELLSEQEGFRFTFLLWPVALQTTSVACSQHVTDVCFFKDGVITVWLICMHGVVAKYRSSC